MVKLIVVRATWDDEGKQWIAESPDLPGLITAADTIEELRDKLPLVISDLLEAMAETQDAPEDLVEVPIELIASASTRAMVRRMPRD